MKPTPNVVTDRSRLSKLLPNGKNAWPMTTA
jgi:hypothetical protein